MDNSNIPHLTDKNTIFYLNNTLQNCHTLKVEKYSQFLNIFIVLFFLGITCFILYLCFNKKQTPEEKQRAIEKDQKYVLEKIRYMQECKEKMEQQNNITHLPLTNDISHLR